MLHRYKITHQNGHKNLEPKGVGQVHKIVELVFLQMIFLKITIEKRKMFSALNHNRSLSAIWVIEAQLCLCTFVLFYIFVSVSLIDYDFLWNEFCIFGSWWPTFSRCDTDQELTPRLVFLSLATYQDFSYP